MTTTAAGTARLQIRGLRKSYGNTRALDGLDLDLVPGEVLGIAGPNGAGKSTLVRILAGEERQDVGELQMRLQDFTPSNAARAVAVVHQEPQLFPNLTVADNLLVGREGAYLLRPKTSAGDVALMEALGLARYAARPLSACTLAVQQRTEIARALARDARVFLFDEPNSALSDDESDELFREIHKLADAGNIVILVTHRLGDLVDHTDRVVVLRDGRIVAELRGAALSEEAIAQLLVLKEHRAVPDAARAGRGVRGGATLLSVSGWTHRAGAFADVTLCVARGEIVALMGVEGSGARELLRSLGGVDAAIGEITVAEATGPAAIGRLTAYVPATRQFSLYSNLSVGENLLVRLGRPDIADAVGTLRPRRMRALAADAVRRFLVKTRTLTQGIRSLSGGNQQKVAIAQALAFRPRVLLLEEPTRGVDIGARREIYRLLAAFAADGNAVVLYCTEVPEMFEAADRVIVVSDGRLSAPLSVADHPHVEALATEVTRLERHGRAE
jgi:ABC-type sugar transport system ATPase subunit